MSSGNDVLLMLANLILTTAIVNWKGSLYFRATRRNGETSVSLKVSL